MVEITKNSDGSYIDIELRNEDDESAWLDSLTMEDAQSLVDQFAALGITPANYIYAKPDELAPTRLTGLAYKHSRDNDEDNH